ncbi:MAG: MATE family efflux transporter [Fenollaria timonensis]
MKNLREMFQDKKFLKLVYSLAVPVALQNLLASVLNTLDTTMISSLGDYAISAVGLANQIFFFMTIICFGIGTGTSVMIAQYNGKEDYEGVRKSHGMALILSVIVASIFTILALAIPEQLMRIFTDDANVIPYGVTYLRVVSFSYILTAVNFIYSVSMRSIGNAKTPLVASTFAFFGNAFFNYVFIFGKLGFPAMGVAGGALGTILARILEFIVLYITLKKHRSPLTGKLKDFITFDSHFKKLYLKTAGPVILNETFWSLGQIIYQIAYAKLGTRSVTALQIGMTVQNIFFVLSRGLAGACTVIVGNSIGAGDEDQAYRYGTWLLELSALTGLVLGALMIIFRESFFVIFPNITPESKAIAADLFITMGIALFVKTHNSTLIVGIFRGGGDTRYSMALEMSCVWLIGVPLAFLGAVVLKLPLHYVYLMACGEEFAKAAIGLPRVISKKWIKNITNE